MQLLPSSHAFAAPAVHFLSLQLSPTVQPCPSLQPLVFAVVTQPLFAEQLSSVHGFLSSQTTAAPVQTPALHASLEVHGLPSSQAPVVAPWTQPFVASHASFVQGSPSSQDSAVPAHFPPAQVSALVQGLPSAQGAVSRHDRASELDDWDCVDVLVDEETFSQAVAS